MGALSAFSQVVNLGLLLKHLPQLDAMALFYSCMLQSGATRFDILYSKPDLVPRSEFLRKRIRAIPSLRYGKPMLLLQGVFENHLPQDYRSNNKYAPVWALEHFLTDLCFAMQSKSSMVAVLGIPKIEPLKPLLPVELFLPVKSLLVALEPSGVEVPLPKRAIADDRVSLFVDLLKSDLFLSYSAAQSDLDFASIPKRNAIARVATKAKQIVKENLDAVRLKRTTVALLPITSKLIDLAFGKLPGTLAEYSTNLLAKMLNEQRRVVVYQFDLIFEEVIVDRIESYVRMLTGGAEQIVGRERRERVSQLDSSGDA